MDARPIPWMCLVVVLIGCPAAEAPPLVDGGGDAGEVEDAAPALPRVDVLLMLDPRKGICDAASRLADALVSELTGLQAEVDVRVAVRSTFYHCNDALTEPRSTPSCRRFGLVHECGYDDACKTLDAALDWRCSMGSGACQYGVLGQTADRCTPSCVDDADCAAVYADGDTCLEGTGGACVKPLRQAGCPDQLPRFYESIAFADLTCRVPWNGDDPRCSDHRPQRALETARRLLEEPVPATAFRRGDTPLLIVFASYHDECSAGPDHPGGDKYDCQLMDQQLGISTPEVMDDYIQRFEYQAGGAGRLQIVILAGDAHPGASQTLQEARAQFIRARADHACNATTEVCEGGLGYSYFGHRWIQLAEALGDRGSIASLCDPNAPVTTASRAADAIRALAAGGTRQPRR